MNISNSLSLILNSVQFSHSEHIVLQNLPYPITPLLQVFCQSSSIIVAYPNVGFNLCSLEFSVPIYANCRPPSHHTVLCMFHFLQSPTKLILLEMCLVCLVSLLFLTIHTSDFISNIMRGYCSRTTYLYLLNNSLFRILKCDRDIPAVYAELYSLSVLDLAAGPGTYVKLSIGTH